ncbi:uncharacterized protein LOC125233694 isoform X3 [Leguminivora glycinivorella]|uniref:uncharacterized protein LOC125226903 isoform X2 n=1 Tax=Leguminivora glycinivorella TaxID=1035111 RepID=UPI00200F2AEA|nr:uncharacterized protein LOC125226903 isoform X2 [Leguminivora glycinivorella]XP_047995738.1 uncharacterized protein LOC125233694 isoform X3 [Leguminivora glycinivorella]
MANFVGNIGVFDHKVQEWDVFFGRLSQFIKLNKISDDNKSAVLLTHLSDESYRLVRNLVHPTKLEEKSFNELVEVLSGHFTPKRSTFADRAKFFEATKSGSESSQDWAARLRGLAVNCEFGTELDVLLRDRFVLGFNIGPERDRLFESDSEKLTLSKALEVAQQAACARQARTVVVKDEPVYRSDARAERRGAGGGASGRKNDGAGPRCSVCGMKNHDAAKCRFRNYKCQNCGQKGHLKKVCGNESSKIHSIGAELLEANECENCKECQMFQMRY